MQLNHIRYGNGKPLLLIHGLGGSWRSWMPIVNGLAQHREVIAIDLPGSGYTPPLKGRHTIATLAEAVTSFLKINDLVGIDAVGSSMGARLVLELARRGNVLGSVVSLDPGGFWSAAARHFFFSSIAISIMLVRGIKRAGLLKALMNNQISRSILLAQFSPAPWKLSPKLAFEELNSYASSASFDELLYNLAYGEKQQGSLSGSIRHPLVIGWGRQDRICFPGQAKRAMALFPDAKLHWFNKCGHFPHWDQPREVIDLVLKTTNGPVVSNPADRISKHM